MELWLAVLLYLIERLAWALAGAAIGLAVEWRWHVWYRILSWGVGRWTRCARG